MTRFALTDVIEGLIGQPIPERNRNWTGKCPLPTHPERHPSFSINLDTGLWMCFSCGEKGGIHRLSTLLEQEVDLDDIEVRRALELASASGFEEPPDFSSKALGYELHPEREVPAEVRRFCRSRRISRAALFEYRIGWDPADRRIAFPYWDDGKCLALKYRHVDFEGDRRRNKTAETGSRLTIMGIDLVRGAPTVFLAEGESDTLAVWSYLNDHAAPAVVGGVPGAMHTADRWELWNLDMLWAERVYVCFDGDDAGDKGADRALSVLGDKAVRVRPPDGMDMSSYLMDGGSLGSLGVPRLTAPLLV